MRIIDFNIHRVQGNKEKFLTQTLIYANATFNMKEVLSDSTPEECGAVSILTPTQTVNCAFIYDYFENLHHAAITDLMLSRIYPNHKRRTSQDIYDDYTKNNIFILTSKTIFVAVIDEEDAITPTENQLADLTDLLHAAIQSDYGKKDAKEEKAIFTGIYWGNVFYSIEEFDQLIYLLNKKVCEKKGEAQYNFGNYDYSSCRTKDDILRKLERDAERHFNNTNLINSDEGR